jgi:ribosome-associated heat shock protein Hsp15
MLWEAYILNAIPNFVAMRIDKYLWCIRVFKTRSLSTLACRTGRVLLNGDVVKPAKEVSGDDLIEVRKSAVRFKYQVKSLPKSRVGAKLVEEYSIDITESEELEKLKMIRQANRDMPHRRLGRPTKKDRRDIDKLLGE